MTTMSTPPLTDHEYDGIREYDNPTPGWWNWLFAATVAFSVCYWFYYHIGTISWTVQDHWQAAQLADFQRIFGKLGDLKPDEPTLLTMMKNDEMMSVARGIFIGNCAQCHGKDGGGINGVNLTDEHYKNVRTLPDVITTITKGAAAGAMPAWENRLSQNERIIVAAYAASLRGTKPATPRQAEGDVIPPWPTP